MDRKRHWEQVYRSRSPEETSWYQQLPAPSLQMIRSAARDAQASLIDIGGGASLLVDCLLDEGFRYVTVLDISARALAVAQQRLGDRASQVEWIEADVTAFEPARRYDIWHDRAAFHFLTEVRDREAYRAVLERSLVAGGQAIIAGFAPDGPPKCSGLPVVRYDARSLGAELGRGFRLEEERSLTHVTPGGAEQRFGFWRFTRLPKQSQ